MCHNSNCSKSSNNKLNWSKKVEAQSDAYQARKEKWKGVSICESESEDEQIEEAADQSEA